MVFINDQRSPYPHNSSVLESDRASQELIEVGQVLRDLRPPPPMREQVLSAQRIRTSVKGINEVADSIETTLRENAPAVGLNPDQLADQISLAKNYVTSEGSQSQEANDPRIFRSAQQKQSAPFANQIAGEESLDLPHQIGENNKIGNASPAAQKIAFGSALEAKIAEGLALPMVEAIKQSQDRFLRGEKKSPAAGNPLSTPRSIASTHQQLLVISQKLSEADSSLGG